MLYRSLSSFLPFKDLLMVFCRLANTIVFAWLSFGNSPLWEGKTCAHFYLAIFCPLCWVKKLFAVMYVLSSLFNLRTMYSLSPFQRLLLLFLHCMAFTLCYCLCLLPSRVTGKRAVVVRHFKLGKWCSVRPPALMLPLLFQFNFAGEIERVIIILIMLKG